MIRVDYIDALSPAAFAAVIEHCCGAKRWVSAMEAGRPFRSEARLLATVAHAFSGLTPADWVEAFRHHPAIGDLESLKTKFASTAHLAGSEQAGVQSASNATLLALASANRLYAEKFGHIFIVCATGKSADAMLALLNARLGNKPTDELRIAGDEQIKITHLRLAQIGAATSP